MEPVLEVRKVKKSFPGVLALNGVDFSLRPSEIHALVGENGAGKSTLIKIISGVYQPTEGAILVFGREEVIRSPSEALGMGIAPVHQELNLQPYLSVAENIFIGRQPRNRFGLVDYKSMNESASSRLRELGVGTDPSLQLARVSVAERQMVSIARAISLKARILILDEPTASLTRRECDLLFRVVRGLQAKGMSIIYISHRLEEIFGLCDRVTIMRDGSVIATSAVSDITPSEIIRKMIGRNLDDLFRKGGSSAGEAILEVKSLNVLGKLRDISFILRRGEILGIAGLVGAGRTELARAIVGDLKLDSGTISVDGKEVKIDSPADAIRVGIGLVPEERKEQGLILGLSVKKNISVTVLDRLSRLGLIRSRKESELAREYSKRLAIKTPSLGQYVRFLSGGNQQRVVIAKWLATESKILIMDEPTRGIDVGAKSEIYTLMTELARQGVAIIMISSELPEILAMSDRILVMREGRIAAELGGRKVSEEEVLRHATGEVEVEAARQ